MEFPRQIDVVYVICHPEKEKDRYERLSRHLAAVGIPLNKVKIVAPCWGSDLSTETIFQVYDPFLKRPCPTFTFKGANLTLGELSLNLNFFHVMKAAIEDNTQTVITLESDSFLREDFVPRLRDLLADLEGRPWDYVSLGEGVGTRPKEAPVSMYSPTKAYTPPHNLVFRCTDSMLFKTDFLKKVISTYIPFKEIIDWEMNFQNLIHRGTALWADPPLAEQGTAFGRMLSTLPA
jgi:hypothetical protein